jgi:hypothetical protein
MMGNKPHLKDPVEFKARYWDEINLYKLNVFWHLFQKGVSSEDAYFYVDPDVYFYQDPTWFFSKLISKKDVSMAMQEDQPYCAGIMYVYKNPFTEQLFDPQNWSKCRTDDQTYIRKFIVDYKKMEKQAKRKAETPYPLQMDVFPQNNFPNGLSFKEYRTDRILQNLSEKRYIAFHFNYIKGLDEKIAKMKEFKSWLKPMEIVDVPLEFQDDINQVCLDIRKTTYPAHQQRPQQPPQPQIEQYFHKYLENKLEGNRIVSDWNYLPIYWTSIAVKKDPGLLERLKVYISDLKRQNPGQRYWTVVQHCKGISSCGVYLDPKRFKVFGTTRPDNNNESESSIRAIVGSGGKTTSNHTYTIEKEHISVVIPLLCAPHITPQAPMKHIPLYERPILASFIGNLSNHHIRGRMQKLLGNQEGIVIESGKYNNPDDMNRFRELMSKSIFALCPRGVGSTSFRIAEALEFGCIPVYISDVFSYPFPNKIQWDNMCISVKPSDMRRLYKMLKQKADKFQYLFKMDEAIKSLYKKYFTMEKCSENILSYFT